MTSDTSVGRVHALVVVSGRLAPRRIEEQSHVLGDTRIRLGGGTLDRPLARTGRRARPRRFVPTIHPGIVRHLHNHGLIGFNFSVVRLYHHTNTRFYFNYSD